MTRYTEGPSDRFNDIDGYYQRDPSAVNLRTNEELRVFLVHLHTLFEGIEALDKSLKPEDVFVAEQLKAEIHALAGSSRLLLALLHELRMYNDYLREQRQSARKAFEAGYDARLTDLLTQLHPADRKQVEWVLTHLVHVEQEAETRDANRLGF